MSFRGRRNRPLWIVLALAFAGGATALAAVLYVRMRWPPERIASELAQELSARLSRTVDLGHASFHLLRGFQFDSLRIGPRKGEHPLQRSSLDSIFIERLVLRYNPWSLLQRRMLIHSIQIVHPFALVASRRVAAGPQEPSPGPQPVVPVPAARSLPLEIELVGVRLEGAALEWVAVGDDGLAFRVRTAGWDARLEGLRAPRGPLAFGGLRARAGLACRQGSLEVEKPIGVCLGAASLDVEFLAKLDSVGAELDLRAEIPRVELHGPIGPKAGPAQIIEEALRVRITGRAARADTAERLALELLEFTLLRALSLRGELSAGEGAWHLRAHSVDCRVDELAKVGLSWLSAFRPRLELSDLKNLRVSLDPIDVRGLGQDLVAMAVLEISAPKLRLTEPPLRLTSVSLGCQSNVVLRGGRWLGGELSLTGGVESCSLRVNGRAQELRQVTLDVGCSLDSVRWPYQAHVHFEVREGFGGFAYLQSDWSTPNVRSSLRGTARAEIRRLRPQTLFDLPASGRVDLMASALLPGDRSIHVRGDWSVDSLLIPHPVEPVVLSPQRGQLRGMGSFDPERAELLLPAWELKMGRDLAARGGFRWSKRGYVLRIDTLGVNLGPIYAWLKPLLSGTAREADVAGQIRIEAEAGPAKGKPWLRGHLDITKGLFRRRDVGFASGQIQLTGDFTGEGCCVRLHGRGRVDSLWLESLGRPIRGTQTDVVLRFNPRTRQVYLDTFRALNAALALVAEGGGEVKVSGQSRLCGTLRYKGVARPPDFAPITERMALKGCVEFGGGVDFAGDSLRFYGLASPRLASLELGNGIYVDSLQGSVRFDYLVDRSGREPVFLPQGEEAGRHVALWDDYRWRRAPEARLDTVWTTALRIGKYRLERLRAAVYCGGGVVLVPFFRVFGFDGSIGGRFLYDLRNATGWTGTLETEVQLSRLSSAALLREKADRSSLLSGSIQLRGKGLRPSDLSSYDGWVDFSRIGSDVADDILRSLDPLGTHRGIQSVRRLLRLGFRPTRMRFELHNGYLYPQIDLKQPWFAPLRLRGGRITTTRVPIEGLLAFRKSPVLPYDSSLPGR
ncbi:MAG: hypothetical protein ONB23_09290 [candidate division KSB1 bacterium]|nr:hypothetical protein [candidate division KSB1 bacterium]